MRAWRDDSGEQCDDVRIGYDNNGDGDILDAGDDLQIDDDFSSNQMSLTYDDTLDRASPVKGGPLT